MTTQAGKVTAPVETTISSLARGDKWLQWSRLWVETLPVSYWVLVALAVLVVGLEQALEYTLSVRAGALPAEIPVARFVLPGLTLYMLVMLRAIKRTGIRYLRLLRPSIRIDDTAYDDRVYRMVHIGVPREFGLLFASVVVVVLWLLVLHNPMPLASRVYLPADPALAAFIMFSYTLFGWIGLNLLLATVQSGRWLGDLSNKPLVINPFDPTNLLPFGNLALLHSLTAAGVLLILLIGLGRPGALIDWLVILLASGASLSALILPLLGVHTQMKQAKTDMLVDYHTELLRIHDRLKEKNLFDKDEMSELANRTSAITNLRKTLIEAPNWPFQNTVTTSRALLVATSPLIYFVLTELIRVFLAPFLQNP